MAAISSLSAHKILDSNGEWTIQALVTLDNGIQARASVPSGRSVGKYEAKLVSPDAAIDKINTTIAPALNGAEITNQQHIDTTLLELDGTPDKTNLGANAILAVSLSAIKAAAMSEGVEMYAYINQQYGFAPITVEQFPTPLLNLINGGAHASNNLEFQSFMIAPATYMDYTKSIEMGVMVYHKLKEILLHKNLKIDVGEEGGFAPNGVDIEQTCHHIVEAIIESGIKAGTEMFLAIDVAASTFYNPPNYQTRGVLGAISPEQLHELYVGLVRNFPILYLEDPFAEDSWDDWASLKKAIGGSVEIVGDDITVTNKKRLEQAVQKQCITGVIIKPNQIGTFSETIDVIKQAQEEKLTVVMSHRSGETAEDTFLADLAVGVGAHYIKAGAPARGERTVKYNRLLAIEQQLKTGAPVAPTTPAQQTVAATAPTQTITPTPEEHTMTQEQTVPDLIQTPTTATPISTESEVNGPSTEQPVVAPPQSPQVQTPVPESIVRETPPIPNTTTTPQPTPAPGPDIAHIPTDAAAVVQEPEPLTPLQPAPVQAPNEPVAKPESDVTAAPTPPPPPTAPTQ